MAKIYSDSGTESGPHPAAAPPSYAKLVPFIVGFLLLLLAIGLFVRAQRPQTATPSASTGVSETSGTTRGAELTAPRETGGTPMSAPPGPKGARATGK